MATRNQQKQSYYDVLKIPMDATKQEIRDAYLTMARIYHPDQNPQNRTLASARFQKIKEAYDALRNEGLPLRQSVNDC